MDENIAQEIFHELFSSLEALETQSAALLQFVKDKGLANEQELARYFENAGNASNVRWRAARVRLDHLISSAIKAFEHEIKQQSLESRESNPASSRNTSAETPRPGDRKYESKKENEKDSQNTQEQTARAPLEAKDAAARAGTTPNQSGNSNEQQNDNHDATSDNAAESAA
jgi:hypothetical protein